MKRSLEVFVCLALAGLVFPSPTTAEVVESCLDCHPELHEDLIVRVAGFSAYFTTLNPDVQDEIISRTEHTI